jgi:hypothetical protein
MAGVVVRVREDQLSQALAAGHMAQLRVRAVHPAPVEGAAKGRELVVRLGISGGTPLVLGRIEVAGRDGVNVARAEAHFCGADADATPLAVTTFPRRTGAHSASTERGIAPVLASRHADDDLCLRYWLL